MPAVWEPQPGPQTVFCACPFRDLLYGGAVGGGKSDALIGDFAQGIEQYGGDWHGVLFRRTNPQLTELKRRTMAVFGPVYGAKAWKESKNTWNLPTSKGTATLWLCHLQEYNDVYNHQGAQYTWVGFDEAGQFESEDYVEYLTTRMRSPAGVPCYLRLTANPGGVGHHWLRERYMSDGQGGPVAPLTPMKIFSKGADGQAMSYHRMFIPARLKDNKYLANDPLYHAALDAIKDPALKKALLDGDWSVVAGAAFPEFSRRVHVIPSGPPPAGKFWEACDWGKSKPYCIPFFTQNYDGKVVIWNELYGKGRRAGEGSGENPEQVWQKIMEIEANFGIWVNERWLDPQHFSNEASDQNVSTLLGGQKARWRPWSKGPGSRIARKAVMHEWLKVVNGESRLQIMDRCENIIRCFETLPVDPKKVEDVDTDAEDHAYDAVSGGLIKNRLTTQDRRREDLTARRVAEYNRSIQGR